MVSSLAFTPIGAWINVNYRGTRFTRSCFFRFLVLGYSTSQLSLQNSKQTISWEPGAANNKASFCPAWCRYQQFLQAYCFVEAQVFWLPPNGIVVKTLPTSMLLPKLKCPKEVVQKLLHNSTVNIHPSAKCPCKGGETKIRSSHSAEVQSLDRIRIEISSQFKFWRRMHHAQRIKKGCGHEETQLKCLGTNLFHIGLESPAVKSHRAGQRRLFRCFNTPLSTSPAQSVTVTVKQKSNDCMKSREQISNAEWIRIEINSLFKFWRRMHHAKRIKKGLWLWSEKNIIEMLSNESIPHHAYTLRRRSMHSPMAPWLLSGASGPARIGIDPQALATCQWISLGWQCGKVNEPVQMDICQVSNEMGEWWRGLGLKESIWF